MLPAGLSHRPSISWGFWAKAGYEGVLVPYAGTAVDRNGKPQPQAAKNGDSIPVSQPIDLTGHFSQLIHYVEFQMLRFAGGRDAALCSLLNP